MNITICKKNYNLDKLNIKVDNLLSILFSLKEISNRSLAFRSGCKSGVCGSCAIRINGKEQLACKTFVKDTDIIEPLKNSIIIKDLIVNKNHQVSYLKSSKAYLSKINNQRITKKDEQLIDKETNCILCNSCFSACPVYEINDKFLSPFALMRVERYVKDVKEQDISEKLESIQINGIWDCTLCGNCNMVCPSNIDIKNDILQLRNKSVQFGYNDPNINILNDNFNQNFGFDPNSF